MKMQHQQLDAGCGNGSMRTTIGYDDADVERQSRYARCPVDGAVGFKSLRPRWINTRQPNAQLSSKTAAKLTLGAGLFFA
jgi:hypothetical protein